MKPLAPDDSALLSTVDNSSHNGEAAHKVWASDLGNGRYRNPIIHADYSDPDVIRHGHEFFMTASSFNCTPGLPILHSYDLVNWDLVNYAIRNLPNPLYDRVRPGCGIWAPAMRYHNEKFWIFFPMPDEGIYITTAVHPQENWSEPWLLQAGKGLIDPCPLWDDDGKAYLVHAYAYSRSRIKDCLRICPMSPDGSRLLGEGRIVFSDPESQPTIEGPKFLKRNGWYYIFAPAGGVTSGWQTALRARDIYGPYEAKVVLAQGRTSINGPHQGAIVDTPHSQWWFVHFQDRGPFGRVTHLQPVEWRDDWPLIGMNQNRDGLGEPVMEHVKPSVPARVRHGSQVVNGKRDTTSLELDWQWNANHRDDWYSLRARPGWLRLFANPAPANNLAMAPNLLLQKFPSSQFTAQTAIDSESMSLEVSSGLVVTGRTYAGISLSNTEGVVILEQFTGSEDSSDRVMHETIAGLSGTIWFKVEVDAAALCQFSYSTDGESFTTIGSPFQATQGIWIGAKVGLFCIGEIAGTHTDFKSLEIR
jgi:beta-xylosidase